MILLDTQSVIWLVQEPERLGAQATEVIKSERDELCLSVISCWEMGMLASKGRITLAFPLRQWIANLIVKGITIVTLNESIATDAGMLPGNIHGDPGDRFIVATARALACPLMTSDRKILAYAAAGHVQAIDARR